MTRIKLATLNTLVELNISPEVWEKLKKAGDYELYKKLNKYANYNELRIYCGGKQIELNGHSIIIDKNKDGRKK